MCFYFQQSSSAQTLQHRFNASYKQDSLLTSSIYNGFQFPKTPIITHQHINEIQFFYWGLIPFWAKDNTIRKSTLNAKIETIHEKPSFKNVVNNRCLVLADSFFEWQWLDDKGKQKQPYKLSLPNNTPFAFAALWSEWVDKLTGEIINTYTILTTEANELMSKIHNTKKRMPIIIDTANEINWLHHGKIVMQNNQLIATAVSSILD